MLFQTDVKEIHVICGLRYLISPSMSVFLKFELGSETFWRKIIIKEDRRNVLLMGSEGPQFEKHDLNIENFKKDFITDKIHQDNIYKTCRTYTDWELLKELECGNPI